MNHNEDQIIVPIPIRVNQLGSGQNLWSQLSTELIAARDENMSLSRELFQAKFQNLQLEKVLLGFAEPFKPIPRIDSSLSLASTTSNVDNSSYSIGAYSREVREQKILKYKQKIKERRQKSHLSRKFTGRSIIAKQKLRIKGRFVKS
ncbi:unnamed protein product [Blepharisma stoltei]|uniref:CCT domain-containing protein n=1 Tax=Blepharisma stoltei TaxID=1481888 RepID=A0AAU9IXM0_9CILI|nr:unnamed protein product [Blepharisma stoltei]